MPDRFFLTECGLAGFCLFIYIIVTTLGVFTGGMWAALGIGLAVILFLSVACIDKKISLPPKNLAGFALAALAVFAVELPFSSHVEISAHVWLQLASIFLTLIFLTSPRLQQVGWSHSFVPAVALAAGIGAAALGCELMSGGFLIHTLKKPGASLTEYNRGIAHLVILAFPLLAGLWMSGRKKEAFALAIVLLFPSGLTESRTAKLALIMGIGCAAAAAYHPLWVRRALSVVAVTILAWPIYAREFFTHFYDTVQRLPPSWRHRVEIWDYLSYRIAERPFFGWGLGVTHELDFMQPHGDLYKIVTQGAPHAHNFIVELWVETGSVGAILGLAFLLLTLRSVFALHSPLRPFALGCWAAAVTVAMFGFDFWTDALWASFALSAYVFGMLQQQIKRGQNISRA